MNECDMCSLPVYAPAGYLATTRQVVIKPAYWQFAFTHQWRYVKDMPNAASLRRLLAEQQAAQATPWLLCGSCAALLGLDLKVASASARLWFNDPRGYRPPGTGPVEPSLVVPLAIRNYEDPT